MRPIIVIGEIDSEKAYEELQRRIEEAQESIRLLEEAKVVSQETMRERWSIMGIEANIQQFIDALFAKIEAQYAHRPLILAILTKIQAEVDAALPQLLTQELPLIVSAITSIVDAEFTKLEEDVTAIPFLPELLKALNAWIDAEIGKLAQQAAKV